MLPPSAGKTPPTVGEPLNLKTLFAAGQLTPARLSVMTELAALSNTPQAAKILGLGARNASDAIANTVLSTAPCIPAYQLYTGVLFTAAQLDRFAPHEATVLHSHLLIFSGLWGVTSALDPLPNYRLSMGTKLPQLGRLSTYWRPLLERVLNESSYGQVLVDCRSTEYQAAWRPRVGQAGPAGVLSVRVCRLRKDGSRQVVSHAAKHTRGLLTRALLNAVVTKQIPTKAGITDICTVAESLSEVASVELEAPDRRGAQQLTLILR